MQNRGHDAISDVMAKRFLNVPWRVGRKVPRNLYANTNPDDEDGVAFGQLDSSWLAEHVVALHNASITDPPPAPLVADPALILERRPGSFLAEKWRKLRDRS